MARYFRAGSRAIPDAVDGDRLAISRFATPQASSRERHDAWIAQGWPSVTRLCDFTPDGDFRAASRTVSLERFALTEGRYGAQEVHRSPELIRRAPIDHLHVTIPLEDALNTQAGRAAAGSVTVIDLTREWRHRAVRGPMVTFPIPGSLALEQRIDPGKVHGAIVDPATATLVREWALRVGREAATTSRSRAPLLATTIVELLAVALSDGDASVRPTAAADNTALRHRAEALIMSSLTDERLSVNGLAERLGVSRARLYRVFRHEDGLNRAIIRERLHAAAEDVALGGRPIAEVAARFHFTEYSHFSRTFLAEFGLRPSEWREWAGSLPNDAPRLTLAGAS